MRLQRCSHLYLLFGIRAFGCRQVLKRCRYTGTHLRIQHYSLYKHLLLCWLPSWISSHIKLHGLVLLVSFGVLVVWGLLLLGFGLFWLSFVVLFCFSGHSLYLKALDKGRIKSSVSPRWCGWKRQQAKIISLHCSQRMSGLSPSRHQWIRSQSWGKLRQVIWRHWYRACKKQLLELRGPEESRGMYFYMHLSPSSRQT